MQHLEASWVLSLPPQANNLLQNNAPKLKVSCGQEDGPNSVVSAETPLGRRRDRGAPRSSGTKEKGIVQNDRNPQGSSEAVSGKLALRDEKSESGQHLLRAQVRKQLWPAAFPKDLRLLCMQSFYNTLRPLHPQGKTWGSDPDTSYTGNLQTNP